MPFLILYLLISSFATFANFTKYHLVTGCRIFTITGEYVRGFPGNQCLFFPNGDYLSLHPGSLKLINKQSRVLWEIKDNFSLSQLYLASDSKRILTWSSTVSAHIDGPAKEDELKIFSLKGKLLYKQKASELYRQAGLNTLKWGLPQEDVTSLGAKYEITHINSFYEIPSIASKLKPSYIKEGNFVVNAQGSAVFILGPDLQKVLKHLSLDESILHDVYDVQVNQQGNLLFFNSRVKDKDFVKMYSNVMEIDPESKKLINIFQSKDKEMFYSRLGGSVQELDSDTWLVSHYLNGLFLYSKKKKEIFSSVLSTHLGEDDKEVITLKTKAVDLRAFLSHWRN